MSTALRASQPTFREYSSSEFEAEIVRVEQETAIERQYMDELDAKPFQADGDILNLAELGQMQPITQGLGYLAIQRLLHWGPERSDPAHQWFYSPNYLKSHAFDVMEAIAADWQSELGESRYLSITSAARSMEYMGVLQSRPDALTIRTPGLLSSHVMGWSFDIDGCGLVEANDAGDMVAINPRFPGYNPSLAHESATVLRGVLRERQLAGQINFVEELPQTTRQCFHVCALPEA